LNDIASKLPADMSATQVALSGLRIQKEVSRDSIPSPSHRALATYLLLPTFIASAFYRLSFPVVLLIPILDIVNAPGRAVQTCAEDIALPPRG
jgi:hypothetical protein